MGTYREAAPAPNPTKPGLHMHSQNLADFAKRVEMSALAVQSSPVCPPCKCSSCVAEANVYTSWRANGQAMDAGRRQCLHAPASNQYVVVEQGCPRLSAIWPVSSVPAARLISRRADTAVCEDRGPSPKAAGITKRKVYKSPNWEPAHR